VKTLKSEYPMSRPKLDKRKPTKSVTLNDVTIASLNALGQGNLSAGIEICFQGYLAFRAMQGMGQIQGVAHQAPNVPAKPIKKATKKKAA